MLTRLNTVINLGLAMLVLVLTNALAQRILWRHDFSRGGLHRLSQNTRIMIEELDQNVSITVMLQPNHELASAVRDLLREYDNASRRINVNYLDPYRDLIGVQALAEKHGLEGSDIVLFVSGDRQRVVDVDTIAEFDYLPVLYGEPRRLKAFHGESAFSSAIHAVSDLTAHVVYYLRGHGERDLNDPHPVSGYSELTRLILDEQMELRELRIADTGGVPDDADMVLVLGPRQRLTTMELDVLHNYLENHGKLMLLLDKPESGMELLLDKWGVTVAPGTVGGVTLSHAELFVGEYGEHPVTRNLIGVTTVFYRPRPLFRNENAASDDQSDRLRVSLLAKGRELLDANGEPVRQPAFDSVPAVAAAIEKGRVHGGGERSRQTRVIVFGDTDFVSNTGMVAGNPVFLVNALNWLVERDHRLDIAARFPETDMLLLSRQHLSALFLSVGLAVPALFLALGLAVRCCRGAASA